MVINMKRKKINASQVIISAVLLLMVILTVFPIYLMLATSTKNATTLYSNFWGIDIPPHTENYIGAFAIVKDYIVNSITTTFFIVFYVVVFAALAGYAFAKLRFRFKTALFYFLLSMQMIPGSLLLVPKYLNVCVYGMADTHLGYALPYAATSLIFSLFLARSFFAGIPDSIFEAARIDGANEIRIIKEVVIPVSKPVLGSIGLMTFFSAFNEYMWAMLILSTDKLKTIPVGLQQLAGQFGTNYGFQMAAYSIVTVPLLIIISCTMRLYVSGVTVGAVKG